MGLNANQNIYLTIVADSTVIKVLKTYRDQYEASNTGGYSG